MRFTNLGRALGVSCLLTTEYVHAQPGIVPPQAAADTPRAEANAAGAEQSCVQAHEDAQLLRLNGKLVDSQRALKACALEVCPAAVQKDCVQWLDEVATQIPTVVFDATTEAGAVQRVTVRNGSQIVTSELDGRPVELDPGYYEFVFEVEHHQPKVVPALLKQGEKNKLVSADFRSPAKAGPTALVPEPTIASNSSTHRGSASRRNRPTPEAVYLLGGLALLSSAAATGFALNTRGKQQNALEECAPNCTRSRIDDVKRSALITDVFMGVAVASAAGALLMYLTRPAHDEATVGQSIHLVATLPHLLRAPGGWAGLQGQF